MMTERIDTAKELIKEETKAIILSGGSVDDKNSEASVMKDLLVDSIFDTNKVILEESSTSTLENLAYSKALILQEDCAKLDIVSNDFHLARIKMTADRLGIAVNRLIPAKSEEWNSSYRLTREYKAYLWYWLAWGWIN